MYALSKVLPNEQNKMKQTNEQNTCTGMCKFWI